MTFAPLPHGFPFRFVDRVSEASGRAEGRVRVAVTANADAARGGTLAAALYPELVAQAALLLEGGDADLGKSGFLAAISDVVVARAPEPGDVLEVSVRVAGTLGDSVKFEGVVTNAAGAEVARAAVVVRKGRAA